MNLNFRPNSIAALIPPSVPSFRSVVHPCMFEGKPTIFVEKGLSDADPVAYSLHVSFAERHGFTIREERRSARKATEFDRRRAQLPMLVLGASMLNAVTFSSVQAHENNPSNLSALGNSEELLLQRDEDIVHQLLGWIRAQDISVANLLQTPGVIRSNQQEMLRLAFGENLPASMNKHELKVYGLYNFKNETVYLLDEIDLKTVRGRAVLVHELVHYAQYRDGVNNRVRCKNELETLAYELEERYLQAHTMKAPFSEEDVHQLSQCS